jgi:L-alanine-DL-glutamate epimerase-like enolase superfamily enzyme
MKFAIYGNLAAKSAVDMALYDIMGKVLGVPAAKLLGGVYRDRVDLSWVVGMQDLEGSVEEARSALAEGYRTIKLKVGVSPDVDVKLVSAVRDSLGDNVPIRLDANQGYDFKTAYEVFSKMEHLGLESIEQPVERWDIAGMAELRRRLKTPIMADESVSTPHDAALLTENRAADCVNIKVGKVGGLSEAKKIASILEAAGLSATAGSNLEVGIGSAASIHFVAATRVVDMPNDLLIGGPLHEYDLIKGGFAVENGQVLCPSAPGLGIEADESIFKR